METKFFDNDLRHCATEITSKPAAAYHEFQVRAVVEDLLADLPNLTLQRDTYGNVLAHYKHKPRPGSAVTLVAHMDHPGFHVPTGKRGNVAHFLGGVAEANFAGNSVTWYRDDSPEALDATRVVSTSFKGETKKVTFDRPLPAGARLGMWSLPPWQFRSDRFVSRACDDLVQVTTIVALLRRLVREKAAAEVYGLFTRAEEIGFLGALASLDAKPRAPRTVPIISLETSQAKGFAKMGGGMILRVGDKSSIFHPRVTRWLQRALDAADAATAKKQKTKLVKPSYQRLLMAGGTCEGTVFTQAGWLSGAMCVALHNYHNMSANNGIGAEAVHLGDWQALFNGLHTLTTTSAPFESKHAGLSETLEKLRQRAVKSLV